MKIIRSLIFICFVTITFASCTVEQEVHFKDDFSGDYQVKIDLTDLIPALPDSARIDTVFSKKNLSELQERYQNIEGISNSNVTYNDGVYLSKFSFADMMAFKKALTDEDGDKEGSFFVYKLAKNSMIIEIDPDGLAKLNKENKSKEALGQDGGAADLFKLKAKVKFDKPIKSVKGKMATFDSATNTISFDFNIADVKEKAKKFKTVVKFR